MLRAQKRLKTLPIRNRNFNSKNISRGKGVLRSLECG